jgi:cytoskeletal protein CcmA (bactofilin family)
MHFRTAKEGYILAWVLVVVLVLACSGMTIMELSRNESILVSRDEKYLKALNLAESGVDFALYRMKGEIGWTGSTGTQTLPSAAGQSFAATVTALPQQEWYRITSVGTAGKFSKTVTLEVEVKPHSPWPDAFEYAIFWANPTSVATSLLLRNNMQVNGNVFGYGGFTIDNNAVISGTLSATGSIGGGGTAQVVSAPNPPPERATLDTRPYDTLIAQAAALSTPADWRIDNGARYTLPNQPLLVRGSAYVDNNAILYGPGKIVATGDIIISNNSSVLEGASLIAGGRIVFLNNSCMQGAGSVIFAKTEVEFNNNADVTTKVAVLSPGTIKLYNNGTFNGIILGDSVLCSNNARVRGMVYANSFVCDEILNNFEVTYDASLLDLPLPDGVERSKMVATFKLGQWNELAVVSTN